MQNHTCKWTFKEF